MIASYALQAIHLVVFIRISLTPLLSKVVSDHIACGLSNVLGNKGAVRISFTIGKTSVLCISCHLAAGHHNIERRNQDWKKVYNYFVC